MNEILVDRSVFFLPNVSLDLNVQTTKVGTAGEETAQLITPNLHQNYQQTIFLSRSDAIEWLLKGLKIYK